MSCLEQPRVAWAMVGLLSVAVHAPLRAQGVPVSLGGRLTTGIFSQRSSETRNATGTPTSLSLNLRGYVGHPDFMTYSVRPRLTLVEGSSQNSFGSQRDSILFSASLFKRRWFPFWLSYSLTKTKIRPQVKEFDLLDRFEDPREQVFSFSQQIRLQRLPSVSFRYTHSGTDSGGTPAVPSGLKSRNMAYGVSLRDVSWGWKWSGSFSKSSLSVQRRQSASTLFPVIPQRERSRLRFRGSRKFWGKSRIEFDGGENQSEFRSNTTGHKASHRFLFSHLDIPLSDRLEVSFSSNFSSNLTARSLEALLDSSGESGGAGAAGTETLFLTGNSTRRGALGVTGGVSYKVHRDVSVSGTLRRIWLQSPDLGRDGNPGTTAFTVGIGYGRVLSWARVGANYGYGGSRSRLSGTPDNAQNHNLSLFASRGTVDRGHRIVHRTTTSLSSPVAVRSRR
jgi:hypothetical protein